MKTYEIPCSWTMYGIMLIEAKTLSNAIKKAIDEEPLPDGDYLPDSFETDVEGIEERYPEEVLASLK